MTRAKAVRMGSGSWLDECPGVGFGRDVGRGLFGRDLGRGLFGFWDGDARWEGKRREEKRREGKRGGRDAFEGWVDVIRLVC